MLAIMVQHWIHPVWSFAMIPRALTRTLHFSRKRTTHSFPCWAPIRDDHELELLEAEVLPDQAVLERDVVADRQGGNSPLELLGEDETPFPN